MQRLPRLLGTNGNQRAKRVSKGRAWCRSALLVLATTSPTTPALSADTLAPIVVTATRTESRLLEVPAPITVVSPDDIETAAPPDLADLLRARGGIAVRDLFGDGTSAVLDLRGFGAAAGSNTLVLVDGRPLSNASDLGDPDLRALSLFDLERAEIVQGSAGVLYGNMAVGGVVNLVSRRPTGREAAVDLGAGAWGDRQLAARLGDRLDGGTTLSASLGHREADNYRDHNRTRWDGLRLRADVPTVADGEVFVELQALREAQQTPGSLFAAELAADRRASAPIYRNDYSDTDTAVARVGLRQPLTAAWRLEADVAYRDNARDFVQSFRAFPGTPGTQDRGVWTIAPRLHARLPVGTGEADLVLGVDWEQTGYALRTGFGPQDVDQTVYGVYGQLVVPVAQALHATLGLRRAGVRNRVSDARTDTPLDDDLTVGTAGLSWQATDDWRLFLRADQNFRFAKVDEHTNVVFGTPVGISNQTGVSYEAGAQYLAPQRSLKAVVYQLDVDDEISFDSTGFANVNLDRTRRRGLLVAGEWTPLRELSLSAEYAYTGNEVTAGPFAGERIPLVAEHSGRAAAGWSVRPDVTLFAEGVYVGPRVLGGDFANAFSELPGYGVVNLAGQWRQAGWRVALRVNNLLNREYSEVGAVGFDETFATRAAYFPSPERAAWVTVSYAGP
jgi:iron complex outermembrane receptor protein